MSCAAGACAILLAASGGGGENIPRYETAAIYRGNLVSTISATGILHAVGTVNVGTQVSG
jgi:hypothetical protein